MLAVTGATGRLGGRVARRLAAAGVRQRLVVTRRRPRARTPGAETARGDYSDADGAAPGVRRRGDGLHGLRRGRPRTGWPSTHVRRRRRRGRRAAPRLRLVLRRGPGRHVHAGPGPLGDRGAPAGQRPAAHDPAGQPVPGLLAATSPATTASSAGPAGDGRVAAVAQDDIADVAVDVLRRRRAGTTARTYDLTGPAALTLDEVAAQLGEATGRRISVPAGEPRGGVRLPRPLRRARLAGRRVGQHVHRDRGGRAGDGVTDDVERVAGHPRDEPRRLPAPMTGRRCRERPASKTHPRPASKTPRAQPRNRQCSRPARVRGRSRLAATRQPLR